MKICIPTETNEGKSAKVYSHFGSAPFFTIYDAEKDDCQTIDNSNQHHLHGTCNPIEVLESKGIDAVVCSGMGVRAIQKLNQAGIQAYYAAGSDVQEIIAEYRANELGEMTVDNACRRHGCH